MAPTSTRALHLFCFALSAPLPGAVDVEGLDGSPLVLHRREDLVAVCCEVSLEDFTGPSGEAHLQDLAWVAPRALRHQEVIERVQRFSPVFPARFGTLFSSLEALHRRMDQHRELIRAFLSRTAQAQEWGLKGFLEEKTAEEHLLDEELASAHSLSPGARYLQERKLRTQTGARVRRWASDAAAAVKQELSQEAMEVVERTVLRGPSEGEPGQMIWNWSFLVPTPVAESFQATAAQLNQKLAASGLKLQVVGPFPPYSFTPRLEEPPA
ncbi:MAG: GvpL/GvpF family gas vesicle protein [Myxococcales bacterium]